MTAKKTLVVNLVTGEMAGCLPVERPTGTATVTFGFDGCTVMVLGADASTMVSEVIDAMTIAAGVRVGKGERFEDAMSSVSIGDRPIVDVMRDERESADAIGLVRGLLRELGVDARVTVVKM